MMEYQLWKKEFVHALDHMIKTDEAIRKWLSGETDHLAIFPDLEESLNWFDDLVIFKPSAKDLSPEGEEKTEHQYAFVDAVAEHEPHFNIEPKVNALGQAYDRVCRDAPKTHNQASWIPFAESEWNDFISLSREVLAILKSPNA